MRKVFLIVFLTIAVFLGSILAIIHFKGSNVGENTKPTTEMIKTGKVQSIKEESGRTFVCSTILQGIPKFVNNGGFQSYKGCDFTKYSKLPNGDTITSKGNFILTFQIIVSCILIWFWFFSRYNIPTQPKFVITVLSGGLFLGATERVLNEILYNETLLIITIIGIVLISIIGYKRYVPEELKFKRNRNNDYY